MNEKWLRFEVEYSQESEEKIDVPLTEVNGELAHTECLNISLYDQADPSNLYLCTIDNSKF